MILVGLTYSLVNLIAIGTCSKERLPVSYRRYRLTAAPPSPPSYVAKATPPTGAPVGGLGTSTLRALGLLLFDCNRNELKFLAFYFGMIVVFTPSLVI